MDTIILVHAMCKERLYSFGVEIASDVPILAEQCITCAGVGWGLPGTSCGRGSQGEEAASGRGAGHHGIRLPAHHWCWAAACVPGRPEPSAWQLAHVKWMHIEALQSVVD